MVKTRYAVDAVVISPAAAATAVSGENGGENGGENEICCECCGDFLSCPCHAIAPSLKGTIGQLGIFFSLFHMLYVARIADLRLTLGLPGGRLHTLHLLGQMGGTWEMNSIRT